ncbi:hypothetical protein L209DRAFT_399089 [Thermothelomyces heterothallicus CBS 203.75]
MGGTHRCALGALCLLQFTEIYRSLSPWVKIFTLDDDDGMQLKEMDGDKEVGYTRFAKPRMGNHLLRGPGHGLESIWLHFHPGHSHTIGLLPPSHRLRAQSGLVTPAAGPKDFTSNARQASRMLRCYDVTS